MTKNWCKRCFKTVVDDTAPDRFLLLSKDIVKCPSCGQMDRVVVQYYKYGEHEVTPDGRFHVEKVKHIGLDPNFKYWKEPEESVQESDNTLHSESE